MSGAFVINNNTVQTYYTNYGRGVVLTITLGPYDNNIVNELTTAM